MTTPLKKPKIDVSQYIKDRDEVIEDLKVHPEIKTYTWEEYKRFKAHKQQQNERH